MATASFRVILRTKYFEPITLFARRNPLVANTIAYAGIGGLAEFTQQAISRRPGEKFQWTRVVHFTVIGVCFNGPVGHFWYRWLDRAIPIGSKMAVAKKLCLDMSVCLPAYIFAFYAGMSVLERQDDVFRELRAKFVPTYNTSICFWTTVQVFSFSFLPTSMRVLYVAVFSFIWTNYLAIMKRKEVPDDSPVSISLDSESTTKDG